MSVCSPGLLSPCLSATASSFLKSAHSTHPRTHNTNHKSPPLCRMSKTKKKAKKTSKKKRKKKEQGYLLLRRRYPLASPLFFSPPPFFRSQNPNGFCGAVYVKLVSKKGLSVLVLARGVKKWVGGWIETHSQQRGWLAARWVGA